MNVTSLELCKELYELSDWGKEELTGIDLSEGSYSLIWSELHFPWYDLGYLLRKLKPLAENSPYSSIQILLLPSNYSAVFQLQGLKKRLRFWAATPEDCAAKLCIELIKLGILKP